MSLRIVASVSVVLFCGLIGQTHAVGLSRTYSWADATTYAWISAGNSDSDNDQGPLVAASQSQAQGGGYSIATNLAKIQESGVFKTAYVTGTTSSPVGGIATFQGSAEGEYTVTSGGTMNAAIGINFDPGGTNQAGSFYGSATAGDARVYFTWSGGSTMSVQEYLNGLLMSSYTIRANSNGKFNFNKTFPQPVSSGNVIDLDAFFVGFDTYNPGNYTRTVTVYGAIN